MTQTTEIYECACGHTEHRPAGTGLPENWHVMADGYSEKAICPSCGDATLSKQILAAPVAPIGQPDAAHQLLLRSGVYIDLADPDYSRVKITDIASGLARICRFGGQIEQFYSVAHHVVIGCHIAPKAIRYDWLMHDAAEAVIGDITSPLKSLLPDYRAIESKHERACFQRFGVTMQNKAAVKHIDQIMLEAENLALRQIPIADAQERFTGDDLECIIRASHAIADCMRKPRSFEWPFLEYFKNYAPAAIRKKLQDETATHAAQPQAA